MQAPQPDAFALKNSGLDAFLYADVGTELNGSPLTVLSVLARLGKDPWAQAAGWAGLPTAATIDSLAQSIAQMPLAPAVLAGSRDIAARLVKLLPVRPRHVMSARAGPKPAAAMANWSTVIMICCGLAVGIVLNMLVMPSPANDEIFPIERLMAPPGSASPAALTLPRHVASVPTAR